MATIFKIEHKVDVLNKSLSVQLVSIVFKHNVVFNNFINLKAHANLAQRLHHEWAEQRALVSQADKAGQSVSLQVANVSIDDLLDSFNCLLRQLHLKLCIADDYKFNHKANLRKNPLFAVSLLYKHL